MDRRGVSAVPPLFDGLPRVRLSTDARFPARVYTASIIDARAQDSIEPLFAHNARLWLRVWVTTQAAALTVATLVATDRSGRVAALLPTPPLARFGIVIALVVAYHVAGLLAYAWIMRRTWAVLLYVPLCWCLVGFAMNTSGAYGLLVLGAILQGFIFLPFAWAAVTLGIVVSALTLGIAIRGARAAPSVLLAQVGGIVATGIMIGTVLLYIHRANREAALRAELLRRLDAAQRDLAERSRDAGILEERQRLSRDIHDTLAQAFASVIKHLEAAELALGAGDAAGDAKGAPLQRIMPHLAHAQAVSRASFADIRHLVLALRPAELTNATLASALGRIVTQWSESSGVAATFTSDPFPPLRPDADVIFLRATQESLSNVARHADASCVSISLSCVDGLALLTVEDDGRGFAHAETFGHEKLGLSGMRERVRRFGGKLMIESTMSAGTSLTVAMPLEAIGEAASTGRAE